MQARHARRGNAKTLNNLRTTHNARAFFAFVGGGVGVLHASLWQIHIWCSETGSMAHRWAHESNAIRSGSWIHYQSLSICWAQSSLSERSLCGRCVCILSSISPSPPQHNHFANSNEFLIPERAEPRAQASAHTKIHLKVLVH